MRRAGVREHRVPARPEGGARALRAADRGERGRLSPHRAHDRRRRARPLPRQRRADVRPGHVRVLVRLLPRCPRALAPAREVVLARVARGGLASPLRRPQRAGRHVARVPVPPRPRARARCSRPGTTCAAASTSAGGCRRTGTPRPAREASSWRTSRRCTGQRRAGCGTTTRCTRARRSSRRTGTSATSARRPACSWSSASTGSASRRCARRSARTGRRRASSPSGGHVGTERAGRGADRPPLRARAALRRRAHCIQGAAMDITSNDADGAARPCSVRRSSSASVEPATGRSASSPVASGGRKRSARRLPRAGRDGAGLRLVHARIAPERAARGRRLGGSP